MRTIKFLVAMAIIATAAYACIPPLKPLPPLGCTYDNAVLVHQGSSCYWVYMNCGY